MRDFPLSLPLSRLEKAKQTSVKQTSFKGQIPPSSVEQLRVAKGPFPTEVFAANLTVYCENGSAKEKKQIHNMNTRYLSQYIDPRIKYKKRRKKKGKRKKKS